MLRPTLQQTQNKGFTLPEILIATALLAILSVGAVVAWQSQTAKARDAQRKNSLREIQFALSAYKDDYGCFLPKADFVCGSDALEPYMAEIPCDPTNRLPYIIRYENPSCNEYELYVNLERTNDESIEKLGCENGCGPSEQFNYYVTSSNISGTEAGSEGETPGCGAGAGTCTPNMCDSLCCPGSNYRCNSTGDLCLYDASCTPTGTPTP